MTPLFKNARLTLIVKSILIFLVSAIVKLFIIKPVLCAGAAGVVSPFFFFPAENVRELHRLLRTISLIDSGVAVELLNIFPKRESNKIIAAETLEKSKQFGLVLSRSKKFQFRASQEKLNHLNSPHIGHNALFKILPPEVTEHLNAPF